MSNCGVAARMFEALYEAGINIQMINTSEIRVSVLLDEEDVNRAVRAIHDSSSATCNRSRCREVGRAAGAPCPSGLPSRCCAYSGTR